jgi:2-oxo-4-hydroxy-4-carboxy-5-ureidoimidazoline decarboxylase
VAQLRARFASTSTWTSQEQSGVQGASEEVLQGLADGNREYEHKFGFLFLVCATGKSAAEMLGLLRERMKNEPEEELRNAAAEQGKITRIRLEKLLAS